MSIWHISWQEIERDWTDEQFNLMMMRAAERSRREGSAAQGKGTGHYMTEKEALASGRFTHGNRPR